MSRAGLFWMALFILVSGSMLVWIAWKKSHGQPEGHGELLASTQDAGYGVGEKWIHDFVLTERSGRTFDSKELDGQVWVTSVFFATCPSVCRQQNQLVRDLQQQFATKGVRFLSITCDPANDTPERLREYARSFDADPDSWLFVTSPDLTYLRRVAGERFGIGVTAAQAHANQFTVIDKWGNNRGFFAWTDPVKRLDLKRMLDELVTETEPPQPSQSKPASDVAGDDSEETTDKLLPDDEADEDAPAEEAPPRPTAGSTSAAS